MEATSRKTENPGRVPFVNIPVETLVQTLQTAAEKRLLTDATVENATEFLRTRNLPTWAIASVSELAQNEQWEELNNRFYNPLPLERRAFAGVPSVPFRQRSKNKARLMSVPPSVPPA